MTVHYFTICFRHLRDQHCSREGGSFVCLYGYNGVCTSLPVEGVSDKDYIAHAMKHAVMQQQRKSNGQLSEAGSSWTVYSAVQNLPAVLNDPFKGKQSNFLTRTWGDGFVEKVDIPKSPYLPEVTMQHFEMYLKKIARVIIFVYYKTLCYLNLILDDLRYVFIVLAIACILYSLFQRYRKHSRMNSNANRPTTPNELLQNFPNLKKVKSLGKVS